MVNGNGNGWIVRWLVGALWGLLTTALIIIGTNVIANDKAGRARDENTKDNYKKADVEIRQEMRKVEKENAVRFEVIMVQLARIEAKL